MHAITIPHSLDGTICMGPYLYRSGFFSTHWMDGGRMVFARPCPSKVRPSRPLRRLSNISESSQAPKHNHCYAAQFKSSTFTHFVDYRQMPFQFQDQDRCPGLHYSCSVCQPQNMAAIPTFTGDGGPILSLTGEQCTNPAMVAGA